MSIRELAKNWVEKRPFLKEYMELHFAIDDVLQNFKSDEKALPDEEKFKDEYLKGTALLDIKGLSIFEPKLAQKIFNELPKIAQNETLPTELKTAAKNIGEQVKKDENFSKNVIDVILNKASFDELKDKYAGVNWGLALLFAQKAIQKTLQPYVKAINSFVDEQQLEKDECPTCGGVPTMAILRKGKKGRRRYLVCGTCHTEWNVKRIKCPYCDEFKQEDIGIVEFDAEKNLRIDTCNACKSYIKTYVGDGKELIEQEDFASIHIDIASEKTGFKKVGSLLVVK